MDGMSQGAMDGGVTIFYRRGAKTQSLNINCTCGATNIKKFFLCVFAPLRFKKYFQATDLLNNIPRLPLQIRLYIFSYFIYQFLP